MKLSVRPVLRNLIVSGVAGALVAATLGAATAHADGTATPWAGQDPNAIGGLSFFDASGNPITGGSTSSAPFAAFAQGRKLVRQVSWTDTKAVLYVYVPQVGLTPDTWATNNQVGVASIYPNSHAPGALATSTLPVNTGQSTDSTLDSIVSAAPNTSTAAGYQNVYEVRLYANAPGHTLSTTYDYADISVDSAAHTWTLVYTPSDATAPGAPTAVTATAGNGSATVSWTAPASDGGSAVTGYALQYSSDGGAHWTSTPHSGTTTSQVVTGLANGTSYVFWVAAQNAVGRGAWSAVSAAVTPQADPSAISNGLAAKVNYGSLTTYSTKLTDSKTGGVLAGKVVGLYRRASSTAAWGLVKQLATTSAGTASYAYKPGANAQYQWRYAGDAQHKAASSVVLSQAVIQVVSARATASTIRRGTTVTFYGTVNPVSTGQKVYLQQLVRGVWKTTSVVAVIRNQRFPNRATAIGFVLTVRLGTAGGYHFRVLKPATSALTAGASATFAVTVK